MQQTFERKLAARIAARNSPEHIRLRLSTHFSLLYLAIFLSGLLLDRILPITALASWQRFFRETLSSPLTGAAARDEIRAILFSVRYEAVLLVLLICSGMTMFSGHACRILLALHALLFGTLCHGMTALYMSDPAGHKALTLAVCAISCFAQAVLLLTAAGEAVIFSYRYRDVGRSPRKERDALSVRYALQSLYFIGTMTVIAIIRALLLFALQNK
jgi:hypothetical protein